MTRKSGTKHQPKITFNMSKMNVITISNYIHATFSSVYHTSSEREQIIETGKMLLEISYDEWQPHISPYEMGNGLVIQCQYCHAAIPWERSMPEPEELHYYEPVMRHETKCMYDILMKTKELSNDYE